MLWISRQRNKYPNSGEGDFKTVTEWLRNNVFKDANHLDPKDWIKQITNKELTAKDFLEYLNNKYKDIYEF